MVKKSLFARLFSRNEAASAVGTRTASRPSAPAPRATRTAEPPVASRSSSPSSSPSKAAAAAAARKDAASSPKASGSNGSNGNGANRTNGAGRDAVEVEVEPVRTAVAVEPRLEPRRSDGPAVKTSEMTREEELGMKLKEGFNGISTVLSGIDRKIDQHQQTSNELIVSVRRIPEMMKDVPDASKAGIELLTTISAILDAQGRATNELLAKIGDVPSALLTLETRFNEQVADLAKAGHRAEKTAHETQGKVQAAFSQVTSRVDEIATAQTKRQDDLLREMRRQQAEQDRRVEALVKRSGASTKMMVFLMIVVIAALLLVVQQLGAAH